MRSTWDHRVKSELGSFGGLYQPAPGEPLHAHSIFTMHAMNFREFTYDNKRADGLDQAQVTISYDNGA